MREQLIAAATRLFGVGGFGGTSLQSVADAVGIRKASLLYHFGSKEELRTAVMTSILGHWKDTLPQILLAATTGERRFEAATEHAIDFFEKDPSRARFLLREGIDRPAEVRALLADLLKPWIDMAAGFIRQGIKEGSVYEDVDPEAYIIQIIHLVVGGVASREAMGGLVSENQDTRARMRAELLRLTRAGLFKEASSVETKDGQLL